MKCNEVMTRNPECCVETTTVDKVAQVMEANDIGPVPIVSDLQSKKLIGIVTDRDLALKVVGKGKDPKTTSVKDVMNRQLVTCSPDQEINQALSLMEEYNVRRIPVVDSKQQLVGIITVSDLVSRAKDPGRTRHTIERLSCSH